MRARSTLDWSQSNNIACCHLLWLHIRSVTESDSMWCFVHLSYRWGSVCVCLSVHHTLLLSKRCKLGSWKSSLLAVHKLDSSFRILEMYMHETFWAETRPETHVFETETRPRRSKFCPIRDKRFLFVILWVFALYFDNYRWIINGLHHKELQHQCCRHKPLCLSQFASN